MRRFLISLLFCAALAGAAELPVTEVVLYKHGVGFFERAGRLGPGESARLDFTAAEMNDVLKSLTLEERGGGRISGLRYDSMDPLSHTLAGFPFHIGDAEPLSGMLDQLKGARLEIQFGNQSVAGIVVNGRTVAGSDKQPEREQLTLLLDSGDLRTVDLSAASGIRFTDPQLQSQFREYLTLVAAARSKDKRSVYIDSTDARSREIVASYTIPAAVWKSSYRLIFGAGGQPVMEGWAIVDNTTGEDWSKIQLSLVSGRPISFVSQLYPPKYITRPEVELPDDAAARPVLHAEGYPAGVGGGTVAGMAGFAKVPAAMASPAARSEEAQFRNLAKAADQLSAAPSTIVADAAASDLGELFEYRIAQPVTIRKNESAMLPFLQQAIQARKLLIWSQGASEHPTNAAELTNSTGKTLDGGPITVYDGGAYGGEALMETLKAGDKRLVSYAVDLGTRVTSAFGSKAAVAREIHANRGVITVKLAMEETRTYTARNIDQKAKTLIIEHPLRQGYTLLNQKPVEKTAGAHRFEIQLAAGATQQFPVSEERVFDQSYAVSSMTPEEMVAYIQNRELSDSGRRQLQHIAAQKTQLAETSRALDDARAQTRDLTSDEDRIRRNIASLNSVSGQQQQVQNYARQLDQHEQQLAALRDREADLAKRKSGQEADLERLVEALSF